MKVSVVSFYNFVMPNRIIYMYTDGHNYWQRTIKFRAGRSDTPALSKVDLGVGEKCRKSGVKSVASRGVGSSVLSSDTSTLFEK